MLQKARGLYEKFEVRRVDRSDKRGGKHHGCEYFVLDIAHDLHVLPALLAYAESCKNEYPELSVDLLEKAKKIRQMRRSAVDLWKTLDEISQSVEELADNGASAKEIQLAVQGRAAHAIVRIEQF